MIVFSPRVMPTPCCQWCQAARAVPLLSVMMTPAAPLRAICQVCCRRRHASFICCVILLPAAFCWPPFLCPSALHGEGGSCPEHTWQRIVGRPCCTPPMHLRPQAPAPQFFAIKHMFVAKAYYASFTGRERSPWWGILVRVITAAARECLPAFQRRSIEETRYHIWPTSMYAPATEKRLSAAPRRCYETARCLKAKYRPYEAHHAPRTKVPAHEQHSDTVIKYNVRL